MNCYAEIGPLCWTVPWKFWTWFWIMVLVAGPLMGYSTATFYLRYRTTIKWIFGGGQQCMASSKQDFHGRKGGTWVIYCVLREGHFGPHKHNGGKPFKADNE